MLTVLALAASEKYPYPTEEFNVLWTSSPNCRLKETNYNNWKDLMKDFIDRRGLIGFIPAAAAEKVSDRSIKFMRALRAQQKATKMRLGKDQTILYKDG
ncbi:hypothetical protein RHSIM_Rhsim05G0150500 [Rhododendron simsii]|uniref:Retrotransposon Copia-like N-terminal domain-containing protein n=1 Tax=Rhododendron simsii TaxID=118357 RepID=A0A834GWV6_RHOSS|nr:hypothetical protein RHSIM_Rhsim05G0150500 [Rhododendron simsii]